MLIDMSPILRGETDSIEIDFRLTPDFASEVEFTEPAHIVGSVKDMAGYIRLSLSVTLPYVGVCARCLGEVKDELSFLFERTVAPEGTVSEETLEEKFDEYVVLSGKSLDVDEELREELMLELPMRVLCSPDCKGLCPKCGKRLNDGACGCSRTEIDPRWAVLKQLLDSSEEK